jgi:hypothetical protein
VNQKRSTPARSFASGKVPAPVIAARSRQTCDEPGALGVRRYLTDLIVVDNSARTPEGSAQNSNGAMFIVLKGTDGREMQFNTRHVTKVMPIGKSNLTWVFLVDGTKEKIKRRTRR